MQTSKFLFAVGTLAAVILTLQLHAAPDNPEQAKMREALRQLMGGNPPQSGAAPVVAPAPVPAPTAVRAPAPTATPVVPAPNQATARFGPVPPPSQPGVMAVVPVAPPVQPTFVAAAPPDDEASLVRAREAMRQKLQELQAAPPSIAAVPTSTAYTAIQVPPSPLSPAQQTKLADLLVQYRADTITAQDYHAQRAAILAGH